MCDSEFELFRKGYSLVTISVLYYVPDYNSILNEFLWQSYDKAPKYPRIERFLNFWRNEIDARIKEVVLCDTSILNPRDFKRIDGLYLLD